MNVGINDNELYTLLTTSKMTSGLNYGCGVILFNPITKKILLAKRTDTKDYATPGGKVEVGESPVKGITRETHEEANVKLNSVKFLGYRCHVAKNNKNWTSFMFLSTDFDDSKLKNQESEMEEWNWYTIEEALSMELFEPTKYSLNLAIELGCLSSGLSADEETINGDGNGDTGEIKFSGDDLPRICDMYLNGCSDDEPCPSYSHVDNVGELFDWD